MSERTPQEPQTSQEDWPMSPQVEQEFKSEAPFDRRDVKKFGYLEQSHPSPEEYEVIPQVPSTSDYH